MIRNIEQLKRDAKRLKKALGITHTAALNKVAQEQGYNSWEDLIKAAS